MISSRSSMLLYRLCANSRITLWYKIKQKWLRYLSLSGTLHWEGKVWLESLISRTVYHPSPFVGRTKLLWGQCNWMWRRLGHLLNHRYRRGREERPPLCYPQHSRRKLGTTLTPLCTCPWLCVFPCVNTPDRWGGEGSGAPPGTNFPGLFREPVHYREQEGTILRSPPTSFSTIFSHSLPVLQKHNRAPPRLPTVHHCKPAKRRLVAAGSRRFQSCCCCLEGFLFSYFSFVMFLGVKINPDILAQVFFSPCVQLEFKVGSREGRGRDGRQHHRYSVGLKRHKEVKKILYELLNSLVLSPKVAMSFRCSVNQIQ